jgi:curved DNA-binding protein CbpA
MSDIKINFYKVLGVDPKCTEKDIKNAYKKLVVKHHPDRGGDQEVYEVIVQAYTILGNNLNRRQYDESYKLENDTNITYQDLKSNSKNFIKNQSTILPSNVKQIFDQEWDLLNSKHGYTTDSHPINQEDAIKKYKDLSNIRKQNYEQDKPTVLFKDDEKFDNDKFNTIFDANNDHPSEIILKKDIPDAWSVQTFGYTSLENINNLYDETDGDINIAGISYDNINFDKKKIKINNNNNNNNNLYNNHNKKDNNYFEIIKNKLNERKNENINLNNKTLNEYKKNDTAGYGIFDNLGINFPDGLLL